MPLEYTLSQRGALKLIHEGFLFQKKQTLSDDVIDWRCDLNRDNAIKCKATLRTRGDFIVYVGQNPHNHFADHGDVAKHMVRQEIKTRAITTTNTPHQLATAALTKVNENAMVNIPQINALKKSIRRVRSALDVAPPVPVNRGALQLPLIYQQLENGERFLFHDSGGNQDRFLVFATDADLDFLAGCEYWFMDGTFKSAPLLFDQLYTIHGMRRGISVPLVFAMLPRRTSAQYTALLRVVQNARPHAYPRSITFDFERAVHIAAEEVFPDADQHGCHFHFMQCIYREVSACGLKRRYDSDSDFATQIRMLGAVAFVPVDRTFAAFEAVINHPSFPTDAAGPIVEYMERVWIGQHNDGENHRTPPKFRHSLWNVYQLVLNDVPKTNNAVEGWHRGLMSQFNSQHPDIWKCINGLKNEQAGAALKREHHLAGILPAAKRKKYLNVHNNVQRIVREYTDDTILWDYLLRISYQIHK